MKTSSWLAISLIASTATLLSLGSQPAGAATLCVNPGSVSGCFKTIGAAVAAASAGDTIQVAPGTYSEDVTIGKSLSLIGANSANTIIDARGNRTVFTSTASTMPASARLSWRDLPFKTPTSKAF